MYQYLLDRARGVANTPYTPYGGQLVADVNDQQRLGIAGINAAANYADPYIKTAAGMAYNAAQPITAAQIQNYQNPYIQNVVDTTQAQFNNQNAVQQAQVQGNATAQGALGGNRVGVAQALTAGQQKLAQDPTIAGLYSQSYKEGVNTALAEQQAMAQGAYSMGNLGVAGQNAALTGANAQIGAGNLLYGVDQSKLGAAYGQWQQAQAFPYQQLQWLAGIGTGVGSQMGGTSSTTGPPPNPWAQYAGLGMAGLGLAGRFGMFGANRGGRIKGYDVGGGIAGTPWGGVQGFVPGMQITSGRGAPPPPSVPAQPQTSPDQMANQITGLASAMDRNSGRQRETGFFNLSGPQNSPDDYSGLGSWQSRGGRVEGYDSGGGVGRENGIYMPRGYDEGGGVAGPNPYDDPLFPSNNNPAWTAPGDQGVVVDDGEAPITISDRRTWDRNVPSRAEMADVPAGVVPARGVVPAGGAPAAIRQAMGLRRPDLEAGPELAYTNPDTGRAPLPEETRNGLVPVSTQSGVVYEHPKTEPWGAMMAAGLGMMASRSPFLGTAIGEGGLTGLAAYSNQQKTDIAEAEKKVALAQQNQKIDQEAQKLAITAKHYQDMGNYYNKGTPLGPSSDPNNPGTVIMDRNGNLRVDPIGYGPKPDVVARTESQERIAGMRTDALREIANSKVESAEKIAAMRELNRREIAGQRVQAQRDIAEGRIAVSSLKPSGEQIIGGPNDGHQIGYDARHPGAAIDLRTGQVVDENERVGPSTVHANKISASQWKHDAWLAAHPGDTQGALDFAGGHRQMSEPEIAKAAIGMAQRDVNADMTWYGKPAEAKAAAIRQKAQEYAGMIRGGIAPAQAPAAPPANGGAARPAPAAPAPAAAPTVSSTTPPARESLPPIPQTVPPGSLYSRKLQQWRSPDGHFYDANGALIR